MKAESHAEMYEGADAFDRFRKAIKAIVGVQKSRVLPASRKRTARKKKAPKS